MSVSETVKPLVMNFITGTRTESKEKFKTDGGSKIR